MEEKFFDASNFEMLYSVVEEDVLRRKSKSLEELPVNSREVLYNSMVQTWTANPNEDNLESLNKKCLNVSIPILLESDFSPMIADEQVKVFIEDEPLREVIDEMKESLEGTTLNNNEIDCKAPEQSSIEEDLDVCSADRREWTINPSFNSPYEFTVNLGASNTFPGISTMHAFKNVVSLSVTHAIIPDTEDYRIGNYPYLYLEIEELRGIYHSTSEHGRRALVKLIRDKNWNESSTSNVMYNLMNTKGTGAKPSVGWQVDTPIGSLSKLTIRLRSPNGYLLKHSQDVFQFTKMVENVAAGELTLTCIDRFSPNAIHIGNRIGFKIPVTEDITGALREYLESNEHEVISVVNDTEVTIKAPVEYYDSTGSPVYVEYNIGETLGKLSCYIMNYSVQSNFGFNVKSIRHTVSEAPKIV